MNIPLIELKVRNMEHAVVSALTEYEAELAEEIKEGVRLALSRKNVIRVVADEAERTLFNTISVLLREEMKKQLQPILEGVIQAKVMDEFKEHFK